MSETSKLSRGETDRLLAAMRSKPQAATPKRAERQSASRFDPATVSFETLAIVKRVRQERALGQALGLDDPYYRLHTARAGATSVVDGIPVVNFCSYDYLGLNAHPEIVAAVAGAAAEWGTSVSASRLTAGERPFHAGLEQRLAALYEAEAALVFVGGHATNVGVIGELMASKDLIVHDALIHNSCVVGAVLSGADRRSFPHNDIEALDAILTRERGRYQRVLIVAEGIYSMDGDAPDLARLIEVKARHGAWLMIDEAHALGVVGRTGKGIAEHQGVDPRGVDIWMGTLSKTTVSCGGYIAGSRPLIDALRFGCSGQVYSVGMPPPAAIAAATALDIMTREPERVTRLQTNGHLFLKLAREAGLEVGEGLGCGVVPVIVSDSLHTIMLAQRLLKRGVNSFPVLPPGVPEKSARLRFFISCEHTDEQIRLAVRLTAEELSDIRSRGLSVANIGEAL